MDQICNMTLKEHKNNYKSSKKELMSNIGKYKDKIIAQNKIIKCWLNLSNICKILLKKMICYNNLQKSKLYKIILSKKLSIVNAYNLLEKKLDCFQNNAKINNLPIQILLGINKI